MSGQNPQTRRLPRIGVLLAAAAVLTACSSGYVDSRREAGKRITVGASNPDVVAICYGGGDPPPSVVKLADSTCGETGRVARYESRSRFACNLLAPTRAFFRCVAPPVKP